MTRFTFIEAREVVNVASFAQFRDIGDGVAGAAYDSSTGDTEPNTPQAKIDIPATTFLMKHRLFSLAEPVFSDGSWRSMNGRTTL
jgi:hypothetical protein